MEDANSVKEPELTATQRIRELEVTVAAQRATIDALIKRAEREQAETSSSAFAIFNQNLELESMVSRRTARLRAALEEVERLHVELLKSTQELEEREEQLRLIVDAFPAPMCVLDDNMEIIEVNSAWLELARKDDSIWAGIERGGSYNEMLNHEFRQLGSNLSKSMAELERSPKGTVDVTVPFRRNEQTQWLSVRARRVTSEKIKRTVVAHVDLTERIETSRAYKRERELLKLVLNNIPHAVYWKSKEGAYVGCNEAFADLMECSRSEILGAGARPVGLITQADIDEDFEVMASGVPRLDEKKVIDEPGNRREFVYSKVPLTDRKGASEGVLAIYADLTEVNELERQLDQARRLEAIGQLSAGIAHEINTPMQYVGDNLHFITRASELLLGLASDVQAFAFDWDGDHAEELDAALSRARASALEERLPEAIESAKEGVAAVSKIVTAMKGFAHPGGGEMKRSSINDAIKSTIAVARNEWKYAAKLSLDLQDDLPLVECDVAEINQVLLNMVVNAAHAVSDESVDHQGTIAVRTRSTRKHVVIEIEDNGCGIPPENIERIFDQFFTTKEVGRGTGQGLAISRSVVERHHGTLRCDSEVGVGARFTIVLPLIQPAPTNETCGVRP